MHLRDGGRTPTRLYVGTQENELITNYAKQWRHIPVSDESVTLAWSKGIHPLRLKWMNMEVFVVDADSHIDVT